MKKPKLRQLFAFWRSSVYTTTDLNAAGVLLFFCLRRAVMRVITSPGFDLSHSRLVSSWLVVSCIASVGTPCTTMPYFLLCVFIPLYATFQLIGVVLTLFASSGLLN